MSTIFDEIVNGDHPSWKVWEDANYLAFLTPFPNTPGYTVVIPKQNIGDYIFSINDTAYIGLLEATKHVAKMLERAFGTSRIAMVFEGTGVAHVHAKLIPLHGDLAGQTGVWSTTPEFDEEYRGWITTAEGPRMSYERLTEIQNRIAEANR